MQQDLSLEFGSSLDGEIEELFGAIELFCLHGDGRRRQGLAKGQCSGFRRRVGSGKYRGCEFLAGCNRLIRRPGKRLWIACQVPQPRPRGKELAGISLIRTNLHERRQRGHQLWTEIIVICGESVAEVLQVARGGGVVLFRSQHGSHFGYQAEACRIRGSEFCELVNEFVAAIDLAQ